MITEVAALAEGWAVLVNRGGRVVHSSSPGAAAEAILAAERPLAYRHLIVRKTPDSTLVIKPGCTSRKRTALIQSTAVDLLRLRASARQIEESTRLEQRQHQAVLTLLLAGQSQLATEVLGCDALTHATVFRLAGTAAENAYHDLWHTAHPSGPSASPRTLVCLRGTDLAVIALHGRHGDVHQRSTLVARIADQHRLAGGAAEPVPLDLLATAWTEAAAARSGASRGCLAPATALGAYELLHIIPPDRLSAWAAQVLHPLTREQRRTLEAYLRAGSAAAAASVLGIAEGTVRLRLRNASTALAAELDDPGTQALLLLAVRAPATPSPT
ncbi:helix-turn-helix domain-containing protein, partial [Streptomyces sp. YS-3]|uniref:helix-turn-helix domain-containing protein n=1 Tax=Streptomyces sp. YS-3 TaxID=3381352 RepID=UPI00386249AB